MIWKGLVRNILIFLGFRVADENPAEIEIHCGVDECESEELKQLTEADWIFYDCHEDLNEGMD